MNITHAVDEKIEGDFLEAIFNRQKELMAKYHDIEKRSGLLQTEDCPVNLDDKRGQARIKDFAWRVTEELGEALDARHDASHFKEELIDGLHFLTELTILSGLEIKDLISRVKRIYKITDNVSDVLQLRDNFDIIYKCSHILDNSFNEGVVQFIEALGMTCNCLKNKPWKQTNMITDKEMFYDNLSKVWVTYVSVMAWEMPMKEIVETYFKKSQVNKFRQRSNY